MKKLLLLLVIIATLSFMQLREWAEKSGPLLSAVNVVIPKGASSKLVAAELAKAGVIDKPLLFRLLA